MPLQPQLKLVWGLRSGRLTVSGSPKASVEVAGATMTLGRAEGSIVEREVVEAEV
jgi:hypothetical protein